MSNLDSLALHETYTLLFFQSAYDSLTRGIDFSYQILCNLMKTFQKYVNNLDDVKHFFPLAWGDT